VLSNSERDKKKPHAVLHKSVMERSAKNPGMSHIGNANEERQLCVLGVLVLRVFKNK
jgi:hypothetical protein